MQLTIALPDDMGRRIRKMRDPDGFIVRALAKAFKEAPPPAEKRGRQLVRELRGRATVGMTTDEIMALTRDES